MLHFAIRMSFWLELCSLLAIWALPYVPKRVYNFLLSSSPIVIVYYSLKWIARENETLSLPIFIYRFSGDEPSNLNLKAAWQLYFRCKTMNNGCNFLFYLIKIILGSRQGFKKKKLAWQLTFSHFDKHRTSGLESNYFLAVDPCRN